MGDYLNNKTATYVLWTRKINSVILYKWRDFSIDYFEATTYKERRSSTYHFI